MKRNDGFQGRLEVSGAVALGDQQRRPTILVLPIPNRDLRAFVREELHDLGKISLRQRRVMAASSLVMVPSRSF